MTDFSDIALPLVKTLKDDPERGSPAVTSTTNSPLYHNDDAIEVERITDQLPSTEDLDPYPENIKAARKIFPIAGLDMLAFYKSFRFVDMPPFRGCWGIFLIDSGIKAVTAELLEHTPALKPTDAQRVAVELLYHHEHYHFWVDAWALAQEYIPLRPRYKLYEYYLSLKHIAALDETDLEESLANNYAFTRVKALKLKNRISPNPALRAFLRNCPIPYSNFEFASDAKKEREGVLAGAVLNGFACAAQNMLTAMDSSRSVQLLLSRSIRADIRDYPLSEPHLCPRYLVRDPNYYARVQPFQMPAYKEFKKFVIKYLGAVFIEKTDHEYFRIDNGEKIRFPNNHSKDIKRGELINILFKAGMRYHDFCEERKSTNIWTKRCPRPLSKPPIG